MSEQPAPEVEPTTEPTHEELAPEQLRAALDAVRREAAGYRTKLRDSEAEAEKWRQHEESQKSELQKAIDRAEQAERGLAQSQIRVTRAEVAAAKGLPADLHEFVLGATKEEMEASADKLLAAVKPAVPTGPPPGFGAAGRGKPVTEGKPVDPDAFIRSLLGR